MIKRLLHVFFALMVASASLKAKAICSGSPCVLNTVIIASNQPHINFYIADSDTTKVKKEPGDKKKIKEIPQARRQAKPEKLLLTPIDTLSNKLKVKVPRQRRPDGLVRPPEIPRRNNN
ncbi:hypothetical protein BDD43_5770 [Mucilaginibacter gracilis]|uniref:Uncharacterized protein n=1 Tax=Mucilaginibacter gracilis TaxID=423350 RepID=A0A495JBQ6_9SPHI|nr:hypothetical protein [Mucilaginibacter gracilis]RKR85499.1 hypothetical protein BDD43_5770 [Mucilaginibacter gracilis]